MVFKYAVSTEEIQDNVMSKIVIPAVTEDNNKEEVIFLIRNNYLIFLQN